MLVLALCLSLICEVDIVLVNDIRQGLIGHDAQAMPLVCYGHSGYGGGYGPLAGHGKEDVTCKVSDPPFTNPTARSDIEEKPMLIR